MFKAENDRRLLVIGLDGGTFTLMRPLLEAGLLPTIGGLIKRGSSGVLESTIPPHSSVAWPSFATGKNPGKHGVFYVLRPEPGSYRRRLVDSHSVRSRTLWELLSLQGKRVGLVDVPITYPPRPINGVQVAGMLTPSEESVFTYPDELHAELVLALGELPIEADVVPAAVKAGPVRGLPLLVRYDENRLQVALHLMRHHPWDFFMVVFRSVDTVQHLMWRYADERLRDHHPELSRKLGSVMAQFYQRMDRAIGKLLVEAGENTSTVILSDHGMGPCRRHLYLNRWLEAQGLLYRLPLSPLRARKLRLGWGAPVGRPAGGIPKVGLRRRLAAVKLPYLLPEYRGRHAEVDWSRTRAYANWTGGEAMINLNVKGREPLGIVSPGEEYETVRQDLCQRLLRLRDPWEGNAVVERVWRREEIYQGPYLEEAPDLLLSLHDSAYHPRGEVRGRLIVTEAVDEAPALHTMEGILIMTGEGIRSDHIVSDARIMDLTPTILHLMGFPVPDDMDGRVLETVLEADFLKQRPVTCEPAGKWDGAESSSLSSTEKQSVLDSLKGLGYVS